MSGFLIGDDDKVLVRFKLKNETEEREKELSCSAFKEFKQSNNLEYCKIIKVISSS